MAQDTLSRVLAISALSQGGGTSDYEDLSNKPSINNVELNGDKPLSAFNIQETLTAGTGIAINNNVISATGGKTYVFTDIPLFGQGEYNLSPDDAVTMTNLIDEYNPDDDVAIYFHNDEGMDRWTNAHACTLTVRKSAIEDDRYRVMVVMGISKDDNTSTKIIYFNDYYDYVEEYDPYIVEEYSGGTDYIGGYGININSGVISSSLGVPEAPTENGNYVLHVENGVVTWIVAPEASGPVLTQNGQTLGVI